MDQDVKGQSPKPPMEINEISARAFGQFYRRGETSGILRWDEIEDEIQLEAINISTELAIKNQKNNEDQDARDTVPQECHHLLDVFEKGEKMTVPPHTPGIDQESTWRKAKGYRSRNYTPSVTTNWRSSIDRLNRMKTEDGFEG